MFFLLYDLALLNKVKITFDCEIISSFEKDSDMRMLDRISE